MNSSTENREKYVEYNAIDPTGIVQVYRNYYWWCVDGDPKRALLYKPHRSQIGAPQCNANETLARAVGERLQHDKYAMLVKLKLAFAPWEAYG
jgi:hypothetical protein